ncbi:MAG: hypothetical protein IT373_29390 [Polyangiaceae bacterium]|nr:hypothetical protein [Polyangiaceae bacterium]
MSRIDGGMSRGIAAAAAVVAVALGAQLGACAGVGACVSGPVSYSYGQRVYCYDDWDAAECDSNDDQHVNGASWSFYGGDTCWDRGLTSGSNPWP